jgi:N-methylhydantoinase A
MRLGVDVGGTFTDAVLLDGDAIHTAKAPTTPGDESRGVMAAVRAVLAAAGADAGDVEHFAHGMTVGTNALLERRGAATALCTTAGFEDILAIARQDRVSLYRLCADRPPPLVAPEHAIGVRERIGADGVVEPLDDAEIDRVVAEVERLDIEAVAICLLFSYLDDGHERRLAGALRESNPELHVSSSSEVLPRFREYERCSTTVTDAYLAPLLSRYLGRLAEACAERGIPEPVVMQSSGGVAPAAEAASSAAWSVLSGPAGGAIGAGALANLSGDGDALGFDMGGTSCDVCVIEGGDVRRTDGRELAGRPIQLPMVDVHTVGAGGGSIGWRDAGGALRVGPRSAGADPGPACYGRGGDEPTVTDANLLLGYLGGESALAGGVLLDADAAERTVEELGEALGLSGLEAAEGIVRVANQEMVRALRVVTVERGIDPRRFALLPFGGAGPMHAAAIAAELGVDRILCPRAGGVLSALGLTLTERRRDTARTVGLAGEELTEAAVAEAVGELSAQVRAGLADRARIEVVYELRYRGQAFELDVRAESGAAPAELRESFEARHEERYGYRDADGEIELVGIRVAAAEPAPGVDPRAELAGDPRRSSRRARFGGEWLETEVIGGAIGPGLEVEGPAVIELPEATLVLPPRWRGRVDERGTIVATGSGEAR